MLVHQHEQNKLLEKKLRKNGLIILITYINNAVFSEKFLLQIIVFAKTFLIMC